MKTNYLPLWAAGLLLASSLLSSCKKELEQATPAQPAPTVVSDSTGVIKHGKLDGHPIRYREINGEAVWQGDILLTPEQLGQKTDPNARTGGAGWAYTFNRWPDAVIPYEIASNLSQTVIKQAIAHWEANTSIDFVPRTSQADYVRFVSSSVNQSSVGKQGGMQEIRLFNANDLNTVLHEIGHAVGLLHEHSRADRNSWITVNYQNIQAGKEDNFDVYNLGSGFDSGASLDFNSIMLYGSDYFSKNGQPTLVRKDGTTWTNTRTALSSNDKKTVEAMYANLYIVWGDGLWVANTRTGKYAMISSGYQGAAKTIAEDGRYIWAIHGDGNLRKTNRFSGKSNSSVYFGTGAVGVTGEDPYGFIYAQQGIRLWKINTANRTWTRLGGVNALENWTGTQALYYHNNALYIVWKNTLYKINTTTGKVDKQYAGLWSDVKGIAAPYGWSQSIYIVQHDSLFRIDTVTGAVTFIKYGFPDVTAMSGVGGNLFMVMGDNLWRVNEAGSVHFLSSGWKGATSIGAIHNANGLQ